MRIKLSHRLAFRFAETARNLTYILKMTPRSHDGQRVMRWRIDLEPDCRIKAGEDHFGNLTHTLTLSGPLAELRILITGELANFDAAGVVRGSAERLPTELFLRETSLTTPDAEVREFAERVTASGADPISKLHRLMAAIHETVRVDATLPMASLASEALAAGQGTGHDLTHVFLACSRHLGWASRCVTGYYVPDEEPQTRHAWAEVHVDGLGWVGFDPSHDICPQDSHIRTAIGLDVMDAAGLRGTRLDGMTETVDATWRFEHGRPAEPPAQSQGQTAESSAAS